MAACNPPGSPIFQGKRRQVKLALAKERIHRVRLVSEATCEVLSVQSPSCVWVRLRNHACNDLRIPKPDPFEALQEPPEEFSYVMAPMGASNLYTRSRVVRVERLKGVGCVVYVQFIDDGYGQWIKMSSLTQMVEAFHAHPWQAIPISLFKPALGESLTDYHCPDTWSDEQANRLSDILSEYKSFRVVPVHDSRHNLVNEYCDYARAEIYGLPEGDEDGAGESIAHRFTLEQPAFPKQSTVMSRRVEKSALDYFNRDHYDAFQQNLPAPDDELMKIEAELGQLFHPADEVDTI